ncbi:MAG: hypothetical protein AB1609_06820 [Bacillota bacterium]
MIEVERRRWLRHLDEATALRTYLALVALPSAGRPRSEPSPLLVAMRDAAARLNALKSTGPRGSTRPPESPGRGRR